MPATRQSLSAAPAPTPAPAAALASASVLALARAPAFAPAPTSAPSHAHAVVTCASLPSRAPSSASTGDDKARLLARALESLDASIGLLFRTSNYVESFHNVLKHVKLVYDVMNMQSLYLD
jgi:hypothetical protein